MNKHLWAVIAGVCVVAVLTGAGASFTPWAYHSLHPTPHFDEPVELVPAHWWKADMTEEQPSTSGALWGSDITAAQMLQQLWPEALQQMPPEAAIALEKHQEGWPTAKYEDWKHNYICGGISTHGEGGVSDYVYYVGDPESERGTLVQSVRVAAERGFAEDRMYRVSLYVGVPFEQHLRVCSGRRWSTLSGRPSPCARPARTTISPPLSHSHPLPRLGGPFIRGTVVE